MLELPLLMLPLMLPLVFPLPVVLPPPAEAPQGGPFGQSSGPTPQPAAQKVALKVMNPEAATKISVRRIFYLTRGSQKAPEMTSLLCPASPTVSPWRTVVRSGRRLKAPL